jgi:endonuclease-3
MPPNPPIIQKLISLYPGLHCFLNYRTPYELICGVILSAQCTDAQVNKTTPALFARYPDFAALARARQTSVEKIIYSTGFYHNKAKHLISLARTVTGEFNGRLPETIDALVTLDGVSRKSANVVQQELYGQADGMVVDTHVKRLAFRMGLTRETSPEKVELDLVRLIRPESRRYACLAFIQHGRTWCMARGPKCGECPVRDICPRVEMKNPKSQAPKIKFQTKQHSVLIL